MSISLEILPTVPLKDNWQSLLCIKLAREGIIGVETIMEYSYRMLCNGNRMFQFWFSFKEREIFPDSTYIEGIKNIEGINPEVFLQKFKMIEYTIRLESKPGRQEGELSMMVRTAGILGEMTKGFILFEQEDIVGFKSDILYTPKELIDYRR